MSLTRNSQIWAPGYIKQRIRRAATGQTVPVERIWVTMADHFEPMWGRASLKTAQSRVDVWRSAWPAIARRCRPDTAGNPPQYTFFFPEEEYHPTLLEPLAELARHGISDVEVHLHHDGEGRQNFIDRITSFCDNLHREHGLLRWRNGKLAFGFIHGNVAPVDGIDQTRLRWGIAGGHSEVGGVVIVSAVPLQERKMRKSLWISAVLFTLSFAGTAFAGGTHTINFTASCGLELVGSSLRTMECSVPSTSPGTGRRFR